MEMKLHTHASNTQATRKQQILHPRTVFFN